jgi:hypothetical protein
MELAKAGCVDSARPIAANPLVSCFVTFDFRLRFLDLVGILHDPVVGNLSKTDTCRGKIRGNYFDWAGKRLPAGQRVASDGWPDTMRCDYIHSHQFGSDAQSICPDIYAVPPNSFLVRECLEEVY